MLPQLEEEEFYHADLIGLDAKEISSQKVIGKVDAIYNFGAGDLIDIKFSDGGSEVLPFTKEYVPEINIKDGFIIVKLIQFAEDPEAQAHEG